MTDVFLRQGEPNPSDVRLQDPTAASSGSSHTISPVGIANLSAFGSLALNGTIAAVGFVNDNAFGTIGLNANIGAAGFANAQAFGTISLNATLAPAGVAPANAFGTVSFNATIATTGIASTNAFGTFAVNGQIAPAGIASANAVGVPTIVLPLANHEIDPVGFANRQSFGSASIDNGSSRQIIYFGQRAKPVPALPDLEPAILMPVGIPSSCRIGVPQIGTTGAAIRRRLARRNAEALLLMAA